ncbi:MAG: DNA polymerase I, partial [Desulfobacteria bacterium]
DGLKEHTVGEAQVEEVFGVPPGKVADLLALAGDPSDNIPGVPGIGEKTASGLIRDFGSLDAVLAHPERLKGARREKIEKGADAARLALRLVTIDRHIPIREDWSGFTPRGLDASRVVPLFRRLGFRKLLDELDLGKETPPEVKEDAPKGVAWKRAGSVEELLHALGAGDVASADGHGWPSAEAGRDAPGVIASAGLAYDGDRETVVGIAVEGKGVHLFPGDASARAARALSARGATIYLHDGKALYRRDAGAVTGEDPRLFDTQVAGYLLEPEEGTPSFAKLRARFLPASLAAAEGESPEGRAAERATATLALGKVLEERLAEAALLDVFRGIDMPLLPVLHRIEEKGIRIDPGIFAELSEGLSRDISAIERKVAAAAGTDFNINSPKQLAFLLFEKLGLPPVKKTKTGYSTDVDVLERLKDLHEIPSLVLEYRTVAKIRSTYVDVLPGRIDPRDGRIHTTLSQTQAATGRLSSSDPNLQNIPIRTELGRRIRAGFVAEKGNLFVGADYSQVELRLLAHLSGDAELIRRFRQGDDIHTATAAAIFGVGPSAVTPELRRRAKVVNFGILYGMSPFGLSRELGIGGKEAKTYIDHYFDRYQGVKEYIDGLKATSRKDGYVLTIMGRRRILKDIDSRNKVLREAAERMAINTPIQGSAADLIKMAMIRVDREFREAGMEARLILQVHDELIVEAPEREAAGSERILKEAMEGVAKLSVPLTVLVSRGKNWGEIH